MPSATSSTASSLDRGAFEQVTGGCYCLLAWNKVLPSADHLDLTVAADYLHLVSHFVVEVLVSV